MKHLGVDIFVYFILISFTICGFNSTEIFTVLNTEQIFILYFNYCTLLFFCNFYYKQYTYMKNFMLFFLTMKTSASMLMGNLLQAPSSDFRSAIKFLFITPQSLRAKIADIVVYTL